VSRLTFNIEEDAALIGVKRETPWTALRAKLFGIDTGRIPAPSIPINLAMRRITVTRPVSYSQLALPSPSARPAKTMFVPIPPAAAAPISAPAEYQVEYRGRLIVAYPSDEGGWTATHFSLGAEPSRDFIAEDKHRFMARILAIASVEIEIDELEQS
jgi:hypothetical protein